MKKVLLSSLLKPVDDVRMYQKLAISLLDTENIHLVVIGRQVTHNLPTNPRITLLGLFSGKRGLLSRFQAIALFWKTLVQEKPESVINSSPDFLIVTVLYKIIFGGTLAFDVRENHLLNLKAQGMWKGSNLWITTLLYRFCFWIALPFVDAWILAERIYADQMPWIPKEKTVVLDNKFKSVLHLPLPTEPCTDFPKKLCYTGTIAHIYGTLEAIELAEILKMQMPETTLVLAGFCQDPAYWQKILLATKDKPWITLIGGLSPVPYSEIERVLRSCDAGILSYLANDSFTNKCPTRFYELAALAKWVLVSKNLAFSINSFTKINAKELLNTKFDLLNIALPSSAFTWDSQKISISLLSKLLSI